MTRPTVATDDTTLTLEHQNRLGAAGSLSKWSSRVVAVFVSYVVAFTIGGMFVGSALPADVASEPGLPAAAAAASDAGLVPIPVGLLIIALANVLIITTLILTSRLHGWRLAVGLGLAYYGVVTFLPQTESWYFLSATTVSPDLLFRLFLMGVPTAFVAIPLAVWILGKGRATTDTAPHTGLVLSFRWQWIWKLAALVAAYVVLYAVAGYFIAWQNPDLRAFYGHPGEALPFLTHMRQEFVSVLPFQALRGVLWVLCALPIILWSRVGAWWTTILVGLFFSMPQNVVHILANPLMPDASVRFSHMIETASSTFVFGMLVVWLLHRELGRGTRGAGADLRRQLPDPSPLPIEP